MSTSKILVRELHNGVYLPALGLGTWQLKPEEAETAVGAALRTGYRCVDDAWIYKNEAAVGKVVQNFDGKVTGPQVEPVATPGCKTISESEFIENFSVPHGKPKDTRRVFVTSKIWVRAFEREAMRAQCEEHLQNFGRSSCDLMILHWPGDHKVFESPADLAAKINSHAFRIQTWHNMEELYREGKCRAIGVSNYLAYHMGPLIEDVKARQAKGDKNAVMPMYNQIEINPMLQPEEALLKMCADNGIVIASYSTMGGKAGIEKIQAVPEVKALADKLKKPTHNVVLRWAMQCGYHIIPKSASADRVINNFDVFGFEIPTDDMKMIKDRLSAHKVINCLDPTEIA